MRAGSVPRSHRTPRVVPRVRPMYGRGRHGEYPLATLRETVQALAEISLGIVTAPSFGTDPSLPFDGTTDTRKDQR